MSTDYQGPHGASRHRRFGCKCLTCRVAAAAERRAQKAEAAAGNPRSVDAGPVREHVLQLRAHGYGPKRVAREAGLAPSVVSRLLYGLPSRGKPPTQRLHRATAEALLGVRATPADRALGARRRLQALMWLGWSQKLIAQQMGVAEGTVSAILAGAAPTPATFRSLTTAYDQLWDVEPPGGTSGELMTRSRTRARARRAGWFPPAAWDDDTIDAPDARPDPGTTGQRSGGARVDLEDVAYLLDQGDNALAIARALNIRPATAERYIGVIRAAKQTTWRTPRLTDEQRAGLAPADVDDLKETA